MSNADHVVSHSTSLASPRPLASINATYSVIGSPTVDAAKLMEKRPNKYAGRPMRTPPHKQTPSHTSPRLTANVTYNVGGTPTKGLASLQHSESTLKDENQTLTADEQTDISAAFETLNAQTCEQFREECNEWDRLSKNYDNQLLTAKSRRKAIIKDPENTRLALHGPRHSQYVAPPTWGLDCKKVMEEVKGYLEEIERSTVAIMEHKKKLKALQNPSDGRQVLKDVRSAGHMSLHQRSGLAGEANITCLDKSTRTIIRKASEK